MRRCIGWNHGEYQYLSGQQRRPKKLQVVRKVGGKPEKTGHKSPGSRVLQGENSFSCKYC